MEPGRPHEGLGTRPFYWVLAGGILLCLWVAGGLYPSGERLYGKLLGPLLRLLCYLGISLMVGQAIETLGWTAKLASWVRPIMRWGHLRDESGAAFTAAFVSGVMANTMLMTFHHERKLSRREMVLTYLVNTGLPAYLVHLPTTFFIIVPLTRHAGLIYLSLTFLAAFLKSMGVLVYSRITLSLPPPGTDSLMVPQERKDGSSALDIWQKFRRRFSRVVLYTLPIYVLVSLMNKWGFFAWMREVAAGWASVSFFSVEAASVVIFSVAAELTSGMAAASALLDAGVLTVHQTVLALVLGSIVATPIRVFRHQLPSHAGIFGLRLGVELLLVSQGSRILSLIIVTIPYLLWGRSI
jgi:hypothetical protein